jgi:hypothetical protein
MPTSHPHPGPAEVYSALWLRDPFPPELEVLARRYFNAHPPEAKA